MEAAPPGHAKVAGSLSFAGTRGSRVWTILKGQFRHFYRIVLGVAEWLCIALPQIDLPQRDGRALRLSPSPGCPLHSIVQGLDPFEYVSIWQWF